jgi:5-formyltetrahydrofolate cyclo-ligase
VGLAFAAQEAEALPREAHDLAPGWIVTEREVIVPRATT